MLTPFTVFNMSPQRVAEVATPMKYRETVCNMACRRAHWPSLPGGRIRRSAAVLAIALYVGPMSGVRATKDGDQVRPAAEQLLREAENALGGAEKLRAIDRLHITVVERQSWRSEAAPRGRSYKLWLPDRFQSRVEGFAAHTLMGGRLTLDRPVSPEARRSAENAIPATFRRVALAFLLRAPGLSAPRLQGEATIDGLKGTLVGFSTPDGRTLKLLLAQRSRHPLALIYPVLLAESNERPDRVWRLEDYREVNGVRFPFRLTIVRPTSEIVTEVQAIKVNPPFTPSDFAK